MVDGVLVFYPSKCEAITFTKKTKTVEIKYKLHDTTLAAVSSAISTSGQCDFRFDLFFSF